MSMRGNRTKTAMGSSEREREREREREIKVIPPNWWRSFQRFQQINWKIDRHSRFLSWQKRNVVSWQRWRGCGITSWGALERYRTRNRGLAWIPRFSLLLNGITIYSLLHILICIYLYIIKICIYLSTFIKKM